MKSEALRRRLPRRRQPERSRESIRIQFFEPPGVEMSAAMQKEVEKHFTRGEFRRVAAGEVGGISYPARVRETYAAELLSTIDVERRARPRLPHRRRLRLLRRVVRAAARARPARAWRSSSAHAFTGEGPDYADAAPGSRGLDRPDEAARAGGRRRSRRRLRPRGGTALPQSTSRPTRCRSSRRCCSSCA